MKELQITNRKKQTFIVKLDDDVYEDLSAWPIWIQVKSKTRAYAMYSLRGKNYFIHHFVAGYPLNGLQVDHINHDSLDNRRENLRVVTRSINQRNRVKNNKPPAKRKSRRKLKPVENAPQGFFAWLNGLFVH